MKDVVMQNVEVAPFTGAWIEIDDDKPSWRGDVVAPFTGAWIEIQRIGIKGLAI